MRQLIKKLPTRLRTDILIKLKDEHWKLIKTIGEKYSEKYSKTVKYRDAKLKSLKEKYKTDDLYALLMQKRVEHGMLMLETVKVRGMNTKLTIIIDQAKKQTPQQMLEREIEQLEKDIAKLERYNGPIGEYYLQYLKTSSNEDKIIKELTQMIKPEEFAAIVDYFYHHLWTEYNDENLALTTFINESGGFVTADELLPPTIEIVCMSISDVSLKGQTNAISDVVNIVNKLMENLPELPGMTGQLGASAMNLIVALNYIANDKNERHLMLTRDEKVRAEIEKAETVARGFIKFRESDNTVKSSKIEVQPSVATDKAAMIATVDANQQQEIRLFVNSFLYKCLPVKKDDKWKKIFHARLCQLEQQKYCGYKLHEYMGIASPVVTYNPENYKEDTKEAAFVNMVDQMVDLFVMVKLGFLPFEGITDGLKKAISVMITISNQKQSESFFSFKSEVSDGLQLAVQYLDVHNKPDKKCIVEEPKKIQPPGFLNM